MLYSECEASNVFQTSWCRGNRFIGDIVTMGYERGDLERLG